MGTRSLFPFQQLPWSSHPARLNGPGKLCKRAGWGRRHVWSSLHHCPRLLLGWPMAGRWEGEVGVGRERGSYGGGGGVE